MEIVYPVDVRVGGGNESFGFRDSTTANQFVIQVTIRFTISPKCGFSKRIYVSQFIDKKESSFFHIGRSITIRWISIKFK